MTCTFQRYALTIVVHYHAWVHALLNYWKYEKLPFVPLLLLQVEQAVTCLVHLAKYGEQAAEKYLSNAPNPNCKEMAEAFRQRKFKSVF